MTLRLRKTDGSWETQSREAYDRGNGATILPYDPSRRTVILTRQFRLPTYVNGNLSGMFFGCKRAVQQMLTQEPVNEVRGRIVNISSQHGMVASPGDFPYGVSKGGTVQLTRQIAVDHARDLIVCNAVAPGKIITGKPGAANDPQALDYSQRRTPWPRLGRPEDVAGAALFLASDMATFVTGVNLMVDGGWMAG